MLIRPSASLDRSPRHRAERSVARVGVLGLVLAASLLIASAPRDGQAESRALDLQAQRPSATPESTAASQGLKSTGLKLNGAGLRRDDVERAIWLIEDFGHLFQSFAETEANKHAKANWAALHDSYVTAAVKLSEMWDRGGIVIADLPASNAASLRDGTIVLDPLLDGSWRSDVVARERQVGGDDWSHISLLSGVLLQQLGRLQPTADWPWFQTHLRRSAALPRARVQGDPEAAAALVRFGHLKDKRLLLTLLSASAATEELRARWAARREAMSREVNDFLGRAASALGGETVSAMAGEWTDYGQSAQRLTETRVQATRRFPVPLLQLSDRDAARGAAARVTPPPRASGGLADAIEDAPERVKSPAPRAPAVASAAPAAEEATVEQAQATAWREDLAARQYQSGGVTIRIDGDPEPALPAPEEDFDKFARVGDMAFRLMAPAAGRSEDSDPNRIAESASTLTRAAPEATGQATGQAPSQASDQSTGQGAEAENAGSLISIWLTSAADQVGAVISLIAFLLLAALVLLIILWIWLSERRRALAEPPIILSVLADDEPLDLHHPVGTAADRARDRATDRAREREKTVDAADWVRVDTEDEATGRQEPRFARDAAEVAARAAARTAARTAAETTDSSFAEDAGPSVSSPGMSSPGTSHPLADDAARQPTETGASPLDGLEVEDLEFEEAPAGEDHLPTQQGAPAAEDSAESAATDIEDDGETTPQDLVSALRAGHKSQFEIALQRLTGLSASDIKAVIMTADGEALATICRALDIDELLFASIFMTLRRQYHGEREVPPHQLSQAIAAFARTTPEDARRQVDRWVMDADFIVVDDDRNTAVG